MKQMCKTKYPSPRLCRNKHSNPRQSLVYRLQKDNLS